MFRYHTEALNKSVSTPVSSNYRPFTSLDSFKEVEITSSLFLLHFLYKKLEAESLRWRDSSERRVEFHHE